MRDLARRGCIFSQHLVGKWDTKHRPYFFLETSIEEYKNDPYSQRKHKEGKQGALAVIGQGNPDAPSLHAEGTGDNGLPSFGYSRADLRLDQSALTPLGWDRLERILPR